MTIQYQPSNCLSGLSKFILTTRWVNLLLFAGLVSLSSCGNDADNSEQAEEIENSVEAENSGFARTTANRPFAFEEDLEGETFTIQDPAKATSFTTQSGTTLGIPANAIVDAEGKLVNGPVTIRYREFNTVAEIISSGIPMTVKGEGGEVEWMQTAGMFEIRGFQDGQAVNMAPNKAIKVDFISPVDGAYDAWVLDDETNEWTNLGPGADPVEVPLDGARLNDLNQQIADLEAKTAEAPQKPTYEKQNEIRIDDPANLNQFPELRDSRSHLFIYAGSDQSKAPKKNPWIRDKDWSRYELAAGPKTGVYELTLLAEDTIFSMLVEKAPKPADLAAANAAYQKLLAAYKNDLVSLRDLEAVRSQQRAFRRTIMAQDFRIHNYDILWKSSRSVPLMADFNFGDMPETFKNAVTVYFVTNNNQVVVGLNSASWKAFRFDPNMDNKLIAVLPDNQVALFKQSRFKKDEKELVAARGKSYTFDMEVREEPVHKLNDLKEVIKMASL